MQSRTLKAEKNKANDKNKAGSNRNRSFLYSDASVETNPELQNFQGTFFEISKII